MSVQGYIEAGQREDIIPEGQKFRPGAVVRHKTTGQQKKILNVEMATMQFSVHGGTRTQFFAIGDWDVIEGQEEPIEDGDTDAEIAHLQALLEKKLADKAAADAENAAMQARIDEAQRAQEERRAAKARAKREKGEEG
jgi:hypothetical protein